MSVVRLESPVLYWPWHIRDIQYIVGESVNGSWASEEANCSPSTGWVLPVVIFSPRYSTIYTMFPVFSLVLDKDVKSEVAMLYPELYKDLLKVH